MWAFISCCCCCRSTVSARSSHPCAARLRIEAVVCTDLQWARVEFCCCCCCPYIVVLLASHVVATWSAKGFACLVPA